VCSMWSLCSIDLAVDSTRNICCVLQLYVTAAVFSYAPDEEDMLLDPNLASHLAHWGINMMQVRA
jgi:hypothetical protein